MTKRALKCLFLLFSLLAGFITLWLTLHRPPESQAAYWIALRSGTTLYQILPDGHGQRVLEADLSPTTYNIGWSPDARWLALITFENSRAIVYRLHLNQQRREKLFDREAMSAITALSKDGKHLAIGVNVRRFSRVYHVQLGQTTPFPPPPRLVTDLSWSPEGDWLYFVQRDGIGSQLYRLLLANPRQVEKVTEERGYKAYPQWSPQGLAYVTYLSDPAQAAFYQLRLLTPTGTQTLVESTSRLINLLWSPDGQKIAFEKRIQNADQVYYREILVYDLPSQSTRLVLRLQESCRNHPYLTWTPDSRHLLTSYACGNDGLHQIDIESLHQTWLTPHLPQSWGAMASPAIDLPWRWAGLLLGCTSLFLSTFIPIRKFPL